MSEARVRRCRSLTGAHKFEGRYSTGSVKPPPFSALQVSTMSEWTYFEIVKSTAAQTYERDVCVRCGAVIERVGQSAFEAKDKAE